MPQASSSYQPLSLLPRNQKAWCPCFDGSSGDGCNRNKYIPTFSIDLVVRYGSLALLVFQNTFLVVFMSYSRSHQHGDSKILYASSTAVVTMEIMKFACCIGVISLEKKSDRDVGGGGGGLQKSIEENLLNQPEEIMRLAVPSVLYSIQNNLLYYALSHLDAATFQVIDFLFKFI